MIPKKDRCLPVVMRADLIAALLHSGCIALRSAAAAATWGQAIEVPEIMLYLTNRLSSYNFDGAVAPLHAANMFTPGAVMSGWQKSFRYCLRRQLAILADSDLLSFLWGIILLANTYFFGKKWISEKRRIRKISKLITLRMEGWITFGPLLVNEAMTGAGLYCKIVLAIPILAIGFLVERM